MSARLAEIELRHIIASLERVRLNLAAGSSKKSVEKLIDDAKLEFRSNYRLEAATGASCAA